MPIYWFLRGAFVRLRRFVFWMVHPYEMTIQRTEDNGSVIMRYYAFRTRAEMMAFRQEQGLTA